MQIFATQTIATQTISTQTIATREIATQEIATQEIATVTIAIKNVAGPGHLLSHLENKKGLAPFTLLPIPLKILSTLLNDI